MCVRMAEIHVSNFSWWSTRRDYMYLNEKDLF